MTEVKLFGANGSQWDLLDRLSPVQLVGGMGGLHLPKATNRWSATARTSGRRYKDTTTDYRQFQMTIMVGDVQPPVRIGDDWRTLDGLFWDALRQDASAALMFNSRRYLPFRLDDDNEHEFPKDPSLIGKAVYTIACVADRPEWTGGTFNGTFDFSPSAASNYYGGAAGVGPDFVISLPRANRMAQIGNPGDLSSYPTWTITGPCTNAVVGVGNRTMTIPFTLLSGQQVVVNTEKATITDGQGNDLWPQMGFVPLDFAPIPPGDSVPLTIDMDNAGVGSLIQIAVKARYRRAWGGGRDIILDGLPTDDGTPTGGTGGGTGGSSGGDGGGTGTSNLVLDIVGDTV